MDAESAFIQLKDVTVRFNSARDSVDVLQDINLNVGSGEFICVVGPSGCGKTTLLRLVAGFIFPTEGEALMEGAPIKGPSRHRGMVFQRPGLYPWLNVYENVQFGPKMRGLQKEERRKIAQYYLKMVRLWEFRDRPPYELSGGMQQRVAIARALANNPKMLLMDEPFGALDALTRDHLQEELLRIWRQTSKTIIFITHSVEEAVYLATSVVVMSPQPGKIVSVIPSLFSKEQADTDSRTIKSCPDFVRLREEVLRLIVY